MAEEEIASSRVERRTIGFTKWDVVGVKSKDH